MPGVRALLAGTSTLCALLALGAATGGTERSAGAAHGPFDAQFTGRTLRADIVHVGDAGRETVGFERWRLEGPWPGPRRALTVASPRGEYLAELVAPSGTLLYSTSFSGIFAEWQTTAEAAAGRVRAFPASVRVPEPRRPARLRLSRRGEDGRFSVLLEIPWAPDDPAVDRRPVATVGEVVPLRVTGTPSERFDLLIAGEGYTAAGRDKLLADARRLVDAWLSVEPMAGLADRIDVRVLFVPAGRRGVTDPRRDRWRASPFGCAYGSLGSDRYVLTLDDRRLRELAAQAPYDALVLLLDERKYGGGGIYGLWATVAADTAPAAYVFVHELGHSIAGLADEYYLSSVAYENLPPVTREPVEPNVTALIDGRPKWADLVAESTPIPTPWNKDAFDRLVRGFEERRRAITEAGGDDDAMEALFAEQARRTGELLAREPFRDVVGAFEGAAYRTRGLWRPALDCLMFRRGATGFCPVCRRAIESELRRYF